MPTYRLTPPGELVEADSVRAEGRTVALIGTALMMNRPRDIVIRRVPSDVLVEIPDGSDPVGLWPMPRAGSANMPRIVAASKPSSRFSLAAYSAPVTQAGSWLPFASAAMALVALAFSIASFARAGPRVKLETSFSPRQWQHNSAEELYLTVTLRHTGLAPVEISEMSLSWKYHGVTISTVALGQQCLYDGASLPFTIKDGARRSWTYILIDLLTEDLFVFEKNIKTSTHFRAMWSLMTGVLNPGRALQSGVVLTVELGNGRVLARPLWGLNWLLAREQRQRTRGRTQSLGGVVIRPEPPH